eukprot:m.200583 g.200583  ORF g.200583 m.200583 type:complete len:375 (-) comp21106_c0_seq1:192-1316(-)
MAAQGASTTTPSYVTMFHNDERHEPARLLIDTDAGTDDAQAILTALASPHCSVEAITTVFGNCNVMQVGRNVAKLLHATACMHVPVFRGAGTPLLSEGQPGPDARYWHGEDGMGECGLPDVELNDGTHRAMSNAQHDCGEADHDSEREDMTAAMAIVRLAKRMPGELTLVALGPLTNVALALQLEPNLPSMLKRVVFMGGDRTGGGNVTPHAEFNAYGDPDALHLCLRHLPASTCVDWVTTLQCGLDFTWFRQTIAAETPASGFLRAVSELTLTKSEAPDAQWRHCGYLVPDVLAVAVAIHPVHVERAAVIASDVHVVCEGDKRGQTLVRSSIELEEHVASGVAHERHVRFVTDLDMELVRYMVAHGASSPWHL